MRGGCGEGWVMVMQRERGRTCDNAVTRRAQICLSHRHLCDMSGAPSDDAADARVVDSDDEYDSEGFLMKPREGARAEADDEEYDSEGFLMAPREVAVAAEAVPECAEGASPFIRAWRWKREHLYVARVRVSVAVLEGP